MKFRSALAMLVTILAAAVVLTITPIQASADDAVKVPADAKDVLNNAALYRWRISWRKPIVPVEKMKQAGQDVSEPGILPVDHIPFTSRPNIQLVEIAPPGDDWNTLDYDATAWPRTKIDRFDDAFFLVGVICMRGTFDVKDPSAVQALYLSLEYRGGVVVYLNGKEVARSGMPEGKVDLNTPALPYPDKTWVDSKGQMLPNEHNIGTYRKAGQTEAVEGIEARDRSLGPVRIPASALVKGTNVLAVAIHRSDYHPIALRWFSQQNIHSSWRPVGLKTITLKAAGGQIASTLAAPDSVNVWNLDVHDRIDPTIYGDPNEGLRPIRVLAARNGTFDAALAVSGGKPVTGVRATVSNLAGAGGSIPASSVEVLYMRLTDGITRFGSWQRSLTFDAVTPWPGEKPHTTQPLWFRIKVPADAAAGEYTGTVTVAADGLKAPVTVPLKVQVADYLLPDPLKFRTHTSIYQSPTTLSIAYKVPMWSEEHWKLVEQSMALLGRAGNDLLNIPVVERTQFGNDEGYVYWVKKADGSWDYDFTVLDRFLALGQKHLGKPNFVALQIWHAGGWSHRTVDTENKVTVLDPKTGEKSSMQVPVFGTPESKKFWSDALTAIRGRLAKFGMEDSRCIGILSDSTAPKEVLQMFAEIDPQLGWMRGCHSADRSPKPYGISPGTVVVLHEHCYGMTIAPPEQSVPKIWNQHGPAAAYFRSDFDNLPPQGYHALAERALYQGKRGLGRMCLDFWDFPQDKQNRSWSDIYNRWPISSCAQRRPTLMKLAWAGEKGPVSTSRYELLLLGLQEAEAMISISEAADTKADKLGPELTARCKALVVKRINRARVLNGYHGPATWDSSGWKDETAEIYRTAAEVSAKLGG